jgi:hypothetical protein
MRELAVFDSCDIRLFVAQPQKSGARDRGATQRAGAASVSRGREGKSDVSMSLDPTLASEF